MAQETAKAEQVRSHNTSLNDSMNSSVASETTEKEKQAIVSPSVGALVSILVLPSFFCPDASRVMTASYR
jgi:biotin carboxyl carrier protein